MADPFVESLPAPGDNPWSLNPPIEEIRERASDVEDIINTGRLSTNSLNALVAQSSNKRIDVPVSGIQPASTGAVFSSQMSLRNTRELEVWDMGHEWWAWPPPKRLDEKRMTYGMSGSSTGEQIAWDRHDRDGMTSVVIGDSGTGGPGGEVDDHDWGVRWTADDASFSAAFWTEHGDTDYFRVRVSLDGSARGFIANNIVDVVISAGAQISYTQVELHSTSGNNWTFWVLLRAGTGWMIKPITINVTTGAIDTSAAVYRLFTIGGLQPYVMLSRQGRVLRLAVYVNPAFDVHKIWLFKLNMDTLILTNPMDGSVSQSVVGSAYRDITNDVPLVAETANTGSSRRMYYPSPVADAVLYSQWTRGSEQNAEYREAKRENGSVTIRTLGPAAGPRNGYTANANYNPGAAYSRDGSLIVTLHNNLNDGGGQVYIHTSFSSKLIRNTSYRLSRPLFIDNNEVMWLGIDHYVDYFNLLTHTYSQVGFAAISQTVVEHPLKSSSGTIWLMDPTFVNGWGPVNEVPTSVPNLATGSTATAAPSSPAPALVERSTKGGMHVASSRAATSNQSFTLSDQNARDTMVAAISAGHRLFMAETYVVTRNPTSGYAPNSATYRHMGIISTASADLATIRTTSTQTVAAYPRTGVTQDQVGTTTTSTGVQTVMGVVTPASGTAGTSTSMWVQHNGGSGSPAESRVVYIQKVEDLTVSGRSEATVAAEYNAYVNDLFATGGRYANDSWTAPPA